MSWDGSNVFFSTGSTRIFELSLHGVVEPCHVHTIRERLRGICGDGKVIERDEKIFRMKADPRVSFQLHQLQNECQLIHYGHPEAGQKRTVTVRSYSQVRVHGNVQTMLKAMGWEVSFEYSTQGYEFACGDLRLQLVKFSHSTNHLVHLFTTQPHLDAELHHFANYLRDICELVRVDHRIFG